MKHANTITRAAALLLCLAMMLGLCTICATALPNNPQGMASSYTKKIRVAGVDTGVTLTQITLSKGSAYSKGTTGLVNVVEIDPKNPNVSMQVLNNGTYNYSVATMGKSAVKYNQNHTDSTVLAAVNGDPWLVYHSDYDGDGVKKTGTASKHVSVSRGIFVVEGELWNSQQVTEENAMDPSPDSGNRVGEFGSPAPDGPAFGVLADGTVIIGQPKVKVTLKNVTANKSVIATGFNRLPAPNAIMVYNHRIGTESMAYTDAYEVYLECEGTATVKLGQDLSAKVVGVYESNAENRPAITEKTLIISARGTSITKVQDQYTIGDTVTLTCAVNDDKTTFSQRKTWNEVTCATGGFFYLLNKGNEVGQPGNATNYPCSIIGIKKDGTILMTSTTSTEDGTRSACQMQDLPALCEELGYYTAILFDGGGSTTMVTLDGDSYVRRTSTPDGANAVRSVISGISVVYNGVNAEPSNNETGGIARLTSSDANLGVIETFPSWEAEKNVVLHLSFDELRKNGDKQNGVFTPGGAFEWNKKATVDESVTSLEYYGWVALNAEIGTFGYQIGENAPVFSADFVASTEQGVLDAAAGVQGSTTASRMAIDIDISAVEGEETVYALYRAPSGATVCLTQFTLTREVSGETPTETDAPADETAAPETTGESTEESAAETTVESDTAAETTAEADTTADETPAGADTTADDTTAAETTGDTAAETTAEKKSGCGAFVGTGVLFSALACAFVLKKRD